MIIIGARAKIKVPILSKYMPEGNEAILQSVSFSSTPRTLAAVRALRSRLARGTYRGAREPFTLTFTYATNMTYAELYMRRVIEDLQKVTGGIYTGSIPVFSQSPFVPINIVGASWQQGAGPVASIYSVTKEYFHLDQGDAQPVETDIFSLEDSEAEIDLRTDNNIPVESFSFNVGSAYQVTRTIDGYLGLKYEPISLVQSVEYFDTEYAPDFIFDQYVQGEFSFIENGSSITTGGKLLLSTRKTAPLIPSTDAIMVDLLNASN